MALVQLHHLLLQRGLVVLVALSEPRHLGLDLLHLAHVAERRPGQRDRRDFDERGQHDDGDPVVAGEAVYPAERLQQRDRDEPEPAEIDCAIEVVAPGSKHVPLPRSCVDREARAGSGRRLEPKVLQLVDHARRDARRITFRYRQDGEVRSGEPGPRHVVDGLGRLVDVGDVLQADVCEVASGEHDRRAMRNPARPPVCASDPTRGVRMRPTLLAPPADTVRSNVYPCPVNANRFSIFEPSGSVPVKTTSARSSPRDVHARAIRGVHDAGIACVLSHGHGQRQHCPRVDQLQRWTVAGDGLPVALELELGDARPHGRDLEVHHVGVDRHGGSSVGAGLEASGRVGGSSRLPWYRSAGFAGTSIRKEAAEPPEQPCDTSAARARCRRAAPGARARGRAAADAGPCLTHPLRHRIVAGGGPGMTTGDPTRRQPGSTNGAVARDGLARELRAARGKPARRPRHGAQHEPICT